MSLRIAIAQINPTVGDISGNADLIVTNASLGDLRDQATRDGMRTLRQQAVGLVERDLTTISEVLRTIYIL